MTFVDAVTPKDTEEVKPNIFVQKKGDIYRVVNPIAWNGQMRWKEQSKTFFSLRTFITLVLIIFVVWSYNNDVKQYKEFYVDVLSNPVGFCDNVYQVNARPFLSEVNDEDTNTLYNNP